ncbi:hypothetical protein Stsp01_11020 [Streptomyces sp. NBRC 13847]|nr:hypothetical protein Stsp01_11020 [Streptomyces sp. NBRC 13847]
MNEGMREHEVLVESRRAATQGSAVLSAPLRGRQEAAAVRQKKVRLVRGCAGGGPVVAPVMTARADRPTGH